MTPWTESLTHRCFHSGLKPNGCVDSRRWSTVVVGWVGHVGNPRGVVQAVCEHGVMSLPFSRASRSGWCLHLQYEQIGEQDYGLAFRTVTSQSHRASEQAAFGAASLAEGLLATTRTLIDRVGHEQPLALELLAEDDRIQGGQRLVT